MNAYTHMNDIHSPTQACAIVHITDTSLVCLCAQVADMYIQLHSKNLPLQRGRALKDSWAKHGGELTCIHQYWFLEPNTFDYIFTFKGSISSRMNVHKPPQALGWEGHLGFSCGQKPLSRCSQLLRGYAEASWESNGTHRPKNVEQAEVELSIRAPQEEVNSRDAKVCLCGQVKRQAHVWTVEARSFSVSSTSVSIKHNGLH